MHDKTLEKFKTQEILNPEHRGFGFKILKQVEICILTGCNKHIGLKKEGDVGMDETREKCFPARADKKHYICNGFKFGTGIA